MKAVCCSPVPLKKLTRASWALQTQKYQGVWWNNRYLLQLNRLWRLEKLQSFSLVVFPLPRIVFPFASQNAWVSCLFRCKKTNKQKTNKQIYLFTTLLPYIQQAQTLTVFHFAMYSRKDVLSTLPALNLQREEVTFSLKTWVSFLALMSKESDLTSQPSPWTFSFADQVRVCIFCCYVEPFHALHTAPAPNTNSRGLSPETLENTVGLTSSFVH